MTYGHTKPVFEAMVPLGFVVDQLISMPSAQATVFNEWCTQIEQIAIASVA